MSFLWLVYIFLSKKDSEALLLLTSLVTSLFIGIGYVFRLYNVEVIYGDFFMSVTVVYYLLNPTKWRIDRRILLPALILIVLVAANFVYIINSVSQIVVPVFSNYDSVFMNQYYAFTTLELSLQNLVSLSKLVVFIMFLIFSGAKILEFHKDGTLERVISKYGAISLYFLGFLDWLIRVVFREPILTKLLGSIFGLRAHSQSTSFFLRAGLIGFQGLYAEPSHYASWCFLICSYVILSTKSSTRGKLFAVAGSVTMILSSSARGFVLSIALLFVILLLILSENRKKLRLIVVILILSLPMIVIIGMFIQSEYAQYAVLRTKGFLGLGNIVTSSEGARSFSIRNANDVFLSMPLMGVGIGSIAAAGFLSTFLASFGIIGAIAYFKILFFFRIRFTVLSMVLTFVLLGYLYGSMGLAFISSPSILLIPYMFESVGSQKRNEFSGHKISPLTN